MPLLRPGGSARSTLLTCFLLAASTALVFAPVVRCGFVNFDDDMYVTENPRVQAGWTVQSIGWAWRSTHAFWHPLTWMSLQLDHQLAGLNPAWFHGTNMLLHVANAVLLFLVLRQLTGTLWPSALAAAFFALHPQHVETVAWIAERKGLLSTFFGLLALAAYTAYARRSGWTRYLLTLGMFACSLLAKPMLVTLPLVWLLLDYWPLRRMELTRTRLRWLLLEKLPALLLTGIICVVAVRAEREIGALAEEKPWSARLRAVPVNYLGYLEKTAWPSGLAVLYPRSAVPPAWATTGLAAGCLLAITLLTVWQAKRRPYLPVGWLWFVGTLFPVVGVVAIGSHRVADRYAYWPHIGLFVLLVWLIHEEAGRWRQGRKLAVGLAGVLLAVCGGAAAQQAGCWRDSTTLWTQALAVTAANPVAHNNLADALVKQGRAVEAKPHLLAALQLAPDYETACQNLAILCLRAGQLAEAKVLLLRLSELRPDCDQPPLQRGAILWNEGRAAEALTCFAQAVERNPANPEAHARHGQVLLRLGRIDEAERSLAAAVRLRPDSSEYRSDLGAALFGQGRLEEAVEQWTVAQQFTPDDARLHNYQGRVCQWRGDLVHAERHHRQALALQPEQAETHDLLGTALARQGRLEEAAAEQRRAVALDARAIHYRCNLALVLHDLGRIAEAETEYREALRRQPRWPDEALRLARQLATAADPRRRCGPLAVRFARQACQALGGERADALETLAAAQAAAGQANP